MTSLVKPLGFSKNEADREKDRLNEWENSNNANLKKKMLNRKRKEQRWSYGWKVSIDFSEFWAQSDSKVKFNDVHIWNRIKLIEM